MSIELTILSIELTICTKTACRVAGPIPRTGTEIQFLLKSDQPRHSRRLSFRPSVYSCPLLNAPVIPYFVLRVSGFKTEETRTFQAAIDFEYATTKL